jgi:hypothetical protein
MENSLNNFAVFILTHGRPNNVITYRTLLKGGYTGDIYIICDNEDKTLPEYKKNFGDKVIVFDKAAIAATFDEADNFGDRRSVVYARNACFDIAKDLGIEYFLQLDDDYLEFRYIFDSNLEYKYNPCMNLDDLFGAILKFYKSIPAATIAMSQGGDHVSFHRDMRLKRKAMNTFFCSTKRPFTFIGRINEDVNFYVLQGMRGDLCLTFYNTSINQRGTQHTIGGMTDIYQNSGTYVKSFYTVMYAPSCVKITEMGRTRRRLHHRISWNNAVPKILDEKHCKRTNQKHDSTRQTR